MTILVRNDKRRSEDGFLMEPALPVVRLGGRRHELKPTQFHTSAGSV
jgi:hypothetical protein